MWERDFDESMLSTYENIIIHCPTKDLAESLMVILERNGVVWGLGEAPTTHDNWKHNGEDTCYWVESKKLTYADKQYAESNPDGEYTEHIKCTFYGIGTHGFDIASEDELLSLLGV